ncbi:MAG: hypothetical protein OXT01_28320 [Rhodospirillaceae bacterium]|nr:hypothetical protein [Rhodospirillaceae bacterium]
MASQSLKVRQLNPAALAVERRAHIPNQYPAFIHLWRILATAAVFVGHATKPDILFDIDVAIIGRATIPTFLLISGYFTTLSMYSGGRFLKKVAKRYYIMLTMFIPASVLIFFMDIYIVHAGAPLVDTFKFDPDLSFARVALDVFNLLTFSGEYWSQTTVGQGVFSNQAIWIIDYIMAYTVMTAALYLLSGWLRVLTIVVAMAVAGIPVLLLSPLWFGGVLIFEIQRRWYGPDGIEPARWHPVALASRFGMSLSAAGARVLAFFAMVAAITFSVAIEFTGAGETVYGWSKALAPYDYRQYLGMAKRFMWQWVHVPSLVVVIAAGRILFDGDLAKPVLRPIQTASQYCFPVFAIHFTAMYFVQALMPDYVPRHDSPDPYIMVAFSFVISVAFGYFFFLCIHPHSSALSKRLFG